MSLKALERIREVKENGSAKLDLSYCDLTEIPKEVIELNLLTNLTTLDLSYTEITNLSFLQPPTNLTTLNLSYNKITDLSFLQPHTNLTTLNLSGKRFRL